LSDLVVGFTTTNTPPARSVANTHTTTDTLLSAMITTRSPRSTPWACNHAAARRLSAATSPNVCGPDPSVIATLSGVASAQRSSDSCARRTEPSVTVIRLMRIASR
jgi:hypothetical protein